MNEPIVAIYALVSSEQQAEANTIASQIRVFRERIAQRIQFDRCNDLPR